MCGICGSTNDHRGTAVAAMNARLVHRGPDDDGVFVDEEAGVALGARRLSIIDVEGGHQPVTNEDGSVVAVLNGEIYNHRELQERLRGHGHELRSRVDTEVLVHLYEDFGDDLVHALEGMFAIAVWDRRRRRLLLARDRFGEKPLFLRADGDHLAFASEATALTGPSSELDAAALDAFFVLGYVPSPDSLFAGVEQVRPGELLAWDGETRRTTRRRYWSPPEAPALATEPADELAREAERLLTRSIRTRLLSDVPLGVFLSGGLDSTLVTALAVRESSHRVKSFTVGYATGNVSELDPARRAAERLGTDHAQVVLGHEDVAELVPAVVGALDQPIADPALVPLHAVARFARRDVTVAVGGEGADELFAGYPRYRWMERAERIGRVVPAPVAGAAAGALGRVLAGRAARLSDVVAPKTSVERHLDWVTAGRRGVTARVYGERLRDRADGAAVGDALTARLAEHGDGSLAGRFMRLDQHLWLTDDVLQKADRAAMLASLELRTPFLHRELAEFAASIPPSVHMEGGGKNILRRVARNVLGDEELQRPKTAFRVPVGDWLRRELAPVLDAQLESGGLYRDGWFEAGPVRALAAEHHAGGKDHSATLWPLLVLGIWLDARA